MGDVRIQFDLPESKIEALNELMNEGGIGTRKELFNLSLSLLQWAIRQRHNGLAIGAIHPDGRVVRELSMPILDVIQRRVPVG